MMDAISLRQKANGIELKVRVIPNAKKSAVKGIWQESLKISIAAPPEGGRANRALCDFCAGLFGLAKKEVSITHGEKSRNKTVLLRTINASRIRSILAEIDKT